MSGLFNHFNYMVIGDVIVHQIQLLNILILQGSRTQEQLARLDPLLYDPPSISKLHLFGYGMMGRIAHGGKCSITDRIDRARKFHSVTIRWQYRYIVEPRNYKPTYMYLITERPKCWGSNVAGGIHLRIWIPSCCFE